MKQNLVKAKKETATERINSRINELRNKHPFITWDMIGVEPYKNTSRYRLTYEGGIVYAIMEKLKMEYVRYGEKFEDNFYHGNTKGFFSNPLYRRIEKINKIKERINDKKQVLQII